MLRPLKDRSSPNYFVKLEHTRLVIADECYSFEDSKVELPPPKIRPDKCMLKDKENNKVFKRILYVTMSAVVNVSIV